MGKIMVYESDGSDGYSPGTWGWQITSMLDDGREALSCDGGYASRELARRTAAGLARPRHN